MTIAAATKQTTRKDRSDMTIAAENNQSNPGQQGRRSIRRLWVLAALAVSLVLPLVGGMGHVHAAGNSDAAHACQQGGYLTLTGIDSTGQPVTFANEGQCVGFVAHGGTIVGINACTVTSTTGCLTFNNAILPSMEGTGNTISLTGSTSFVDTCTSGDCVFSTFPNTLATGGGTYVEKGSTGAVISQGIYRIADTAGSFEGLYSLEYNDLNDNLVSSCAAATGFRQVVLYATLIDSTTGATQVAGFTAVTSVIPITPAPPFADVVTTSDQFLGTVSSSAMSLTC